MQKYMFVLKVNETHIEFKFANQCSFEEAFVHKLENDLCIFGRFLVNIFSFDEQMLAP